MTKNTRIVENELKYVELCVNIKNNTLLNFIKKGMKKEWKLNFYVKSVLYWLNLMVRLIIIHQN